MKTFKKVYKVPDGKLLKVFADMEDGLFRSVSITGDFFMHPEECIEELESLLPGMRPGDAAVEEAVRGFFLREDVQTLGITPNAVLLVLSEIGKEAESAGAVSGISGNGKEV